MQASIALIKLYIIYTRAKGFDLFSWKILHRLILITAAVSIFTVLFRIKIL